MRKGPIFIFIGIALALLSVPMLLGFTLYDQRTVSSFDFEELDEEYGSVELVYTFEDLGSGKIIVSSRSILAAGDLEVRVTREDDGEIIDEYVMKPGMITWEKRETKVRQGGDYTLSIIVPTDERWLIDMNARFSGDYSTLGLISAVLGFPTFLLAGIAGIVLGLIRVYRTKRGLDEEKGTEYDRSHGEHITYVDEKKEEYETYETSPRREELWIDPSSNPYDEVPEDYYDQKRKESKAFSGKWHQRWGEEIEDRLSGAGRGDAERSSDRNRGSER